MRAEMKSEIIDDLLKMAVKNARKVNFFTDIKSSLINSWSGFSR